MMQVNIEEKTEVRKHIIKELSENPDVEQVLDFPEDFEIPLDENGVPIGHTWEETREMMYNNLSEHYNVDLRTL
jgi:hypothetical protein